MRKFTYRVSGTCPRSHSQKMVMLRFGPSWSDSQDCALRIAPCRWAVGLRGGGRCFRVGDGAYLKVPPKAACILETEAWQEMLNTFIRPAGSRKMRRTVRMDISLAEALI